MEISSNIWSILTTENEMMTKIINAPTTIIEIWLGFLLFTTILKIKYTHFQKIIVITILSTVSLITEFFIPQPFNTFINYIIMFATLKLVLKISFFKSLLCTIVPSIIFALTSGLLLKPFLIITKLTYNQINNVALYRIIYNLILYTITYTIIIIIKNIKLQLHYIADFSFNNKKTIFLNLIFGFLTLCIQLTITVFYTDKLPIIISFLSFISLFAYFFISFYSLNKTMKLQVTTENLETAKNYNETLTYLYDNVKAFKHDFDNMVFVLGGFIENNDINKLKKYYKNLEKDCERVNNLALLNPKLINNSGVYNLLMSKYKKASEYNVEIKLEYFFDLEKLNMPIYEFSRILGILLDNALEAAKDSKEKQIHILFRDSQRNNTQIISIKNSYSNKDVDTSKIFEKGKTSKENHTGMGLWEVKQILNRNNNVNLITVKDEKYFKQSVEIYY